MSSVVLCSVLKKQQKNQKKTPKNKTVVLEVIQVLAIKAIWDT